MCVATWGHNARAGRRYELVLRQAWTESTPQTALNLSPLHGNGQRHLTPATVITASDVQRDEGQFFRRHLAAEQVDSEGIEDAAHG